MQQTSRSVCDEVLTQGNVSMDGTEHTLLADADCLTYAPGVLLMKVKLSRRGDTSTHPVHTKDSLLFADFVKHVWLL